MPIKDNGKMEILAELAEEDEGQAECSEEERKIEEIRE